MNKNILFVDDEGSILDVYKNLFAKKNNAAMDSIQQRLEKLSGQKIAEAAPSKGQDEFTVFTASQGKDAINIVTEQRAKNDPIQLVFVDMRMPPGINGEETIKAIAQVDSDVQIVLVTAYSDIKLSLVNQEASIPERLIFLKKPFDNEEILQLVRNLSSKYQAQRARELFLATVTHQLRTPVSIIKGFADVLEDSLHEEDEKLDMVIKIKESALRLNEDISAMLNMVKDKTG